MISSVPNPRLLPVPIKVVQKKLFKCLYIVSLRHLVDSYSKRPQLWSFFSVYILPDLLKDLVRSYEVADYDEFIWHQIEKKYDAAKRADGPEYILIQFFLDAIVEELDHYLTSVLEGADITRIVTCKWLNDTDVVLGILND